MDLLSCLAGTFAKRVSGSDRARREFAPHTDPELKRKPQCYAKLVRDVSLRGLVSFGAPSEATVGVFVVPKKLRKQRLIFDTRRVNQHFRRPWHCVLPTPAWWAGLQLPTYLMAQTDVNTAFCRILAPSGTPCISFLPSVLTQLLFREGDRVPNHFATSVRRVSATSGSCNGFFLGSPLLSEDGGELRSSRWFLSGRIAHGSALGTRDNSGFDLFRGLGFTLTVSVPWAATV